MRARGTRGGDEGRGGGIRGRGREGVEGGGDQRKGKGRR